MPTTASNLCTCGAQMIPHDRIEGVCPPFVVCPLRHPDGGVILSTAEESALDTMARHLREAHRG